MNDPRSILVVSLRYLGDLLLATPLIRSLRAAYPVAAIDALVFAGGEGALEGNPDVRRAIATERGEILPLWRALGQRYDLAVIAETADRPHLCGWLAARRRVGLLPPEPGKRWWKSLLLERSVISPAEQPRPVAYRALAEALEIEWRPAMVAPTAHTPAAAWRELVEFDAATERFAVLHLAPRFRYKRWNTPGWHALIAWLHGQGMRVVITGGPGADELAYAREVLAGVRPSVTDTTGRLRFAQTADLLRRAAVYVGPDTATTHLAAACGTPTVALFGPTDPRLWGPIPREGLAEPYEKVQPLQRRDRVVLLQEPSLACVPCQQEGCERHRQSRADCLDRMDAARVIEAALELLESGR
ncbi:MAG: glycosyltransferase family 9 protein [Burkholderiales bacterium]